MGSTRSAPLGVEASRTSCGAQEIIHARNTAGDRPGCMEMIMSR